MQKLSEEKLLARDARRDLNAELLESINNLNAGKVVRVSVVTRAGHLIEAPAEKSLLAAT